MSRHMPPSWSWDGIEAGPLKPRAYRTVTDDQGMAIVVRRCCRCATWRPQDYDHFSTRQTRGRYVLRWDSMCRPCRRERNREVVSRRTPEQIAADRARRRERLKDPVIREQQRWQERHSRERNRERYRELSRERNRRYRARVMADPERAARKRAKQREYRARIREQARLLAEPTVLRVVPSPGQGVNERTGIPSRPIADFIAVQTGGEYKDLCESVNVTPRTVYAWRSGERPAANFEMVDRFLVAMEALWFDVWNEDTCRLPLVTVTTHGRRSTRISKAGDREMRLKRTGTFGYGDAGPDLEAIARVRFAFSCACEDERVSFESCRCGAAVIQPEAVAA